MNKSKLRKQNIEYLHNLSNDERIKIEQNLVENLLSEKIWKDARVIGTTISQDNEWNTKPIIEAAWKQGKIVCVPKCYPSEKKLAFYQIESYDQLEIVFYNLEEPNPKETTFIEKEDIDLLTVPGLVFNKAGYRIGFGGGYYDRFLTDFPGTTVSLFSSKQLVEDLPTESYDMAVQHLITENGKMK